MNLTEHGNNADIKVHILDDEKMKEAGFTWAPTNCWYMFEIVYPPDISFNFRIRSEDDWQIDILDEAFCQPYDYQYLLKSGTQHPRAATVVKWRVDKIMTRLTELGIISGWEVGDYV